MFNGNGRKRRRFPFRWNTFRNLGWRITAIKPVKNGKKRPRFTPFTAGIKPFYSRFRPYKTSFPTVGIIDLEKKKNDILLLFFKCNNKCFVLYESHGFNFSCIIIRSFFPDIDVNMSAMVIWLNMKKLTIDIAENDAWQTAVFIDFICLTTRITATVFRSFVTNVLFLFCCYVTLHSQHMHSWSGNNKKIKFNIFLRFDIFYVTINHQSFFQKIAASIFLC